MDFLDIMDKSLSELELWKDCPSVSESEAPSVKSLIPIQDLTHVKVKSNAPTAQYHSVSIKQFNNILSLLNNSLESLATKGDSK